MEEGAALPNNTDQEAPPRIEACLNCARLEADRAEVYRDLVTTRALLSRALSRVEALVVGKP